MNDGQKQFLSFFLMNTKDEDKEAAEMILKDSFEAQKSRALTMKDFEALQADLLPLVIPDKLADVKKAMAHFSGNLK